MSSGCERRYSSRHVYPGEGTGASATTGAEDSLDLISELERTKAGIEKAKTAIAIEQYNQHSLQHRQRTFEWQYNSSRIIFWVVILIVISGIVYSGIQFYYSIYEIRADGADSN